MQVNPPKDSSEYGRVILKAKIKTILTKRFQVEFTCEWPIIVFLIFIFFTVLGLI